MRDPRGELEGRRTPWLVSFDTSQPRSYLQMPIGRTELGATPKLSSSVALLDGTVVVPQKTLRTYAPAFPVMLVSPFTTEKLIPKLSACRRATPALPCCARRSPRD